MNYLGHLLLSGQDEGLLMGNFMVDRLGVKELLTLDARYQDGVLFHRHIDMTTDNHPWFKASLKMLYPVYKKYAAVVLDVFIDYLMASRWSEYSNENFSGFKQRVYGVLNRHVHFMPLQSQSSIRYMIEHDFIEQYDDWEGLAMVFARLDDRTSFPSRFVDNINFLKQHESKFQEDFRRFFLDLQRSCDDFIIGL